MSETKTTKYTSGPWQVFDADPTTVYGPHRDYLAACDPTHIGKAGSAYGERLANARLMAAAPELLEALQEYVAAADANQHVIFHHVIFHHKARAIIAKALGEQLPT